MAIVWTPPGLFSTTTFQPSPSVKAVIETSSMGKAAKHLGMSQPGVSKAIVELEDALGVRLLDRSRRGIVPTAYGLALQRQGSVVFNELKQAVQHIDFLADPTKGE